MANDESDVLAGVGIRLRDLRKRRGTTLAELSQATGISVSTLSRLEAGGRKPTLELLLPLARAHQVSLDALVDAPDTADPRVHPKPIQHHGVTFLPLSRRPIGLQAFKQIFPPHTPTLPQTPQRHDGYEWLYVLSGRIHLVLGDRELTLSEGEAAEFDTRLPHLIANTSDRPAEILSLFGPQGERMHVRARPRSRAAGVPEEE